MAQKVPVTVVTGFLGAGKTSLIRHWLENADGRRLAIIVNEFGDVGVDGEILRGCGIESCADEDIMELANGCLCCTVEERVSVLRRTGARTLALSTEDDPFLALHRHFQRQGGRR